jgi:predicted component of type VI protein secretion system
MTRDSGDQYQRFFGEEFARAYEEQMVKLTQGR